MLRLLYIYQLAICLPLAWAVEEKHEVRLPLCPRHLEYFPQSLPMHCRMPRNIDTGLYPGMPEFQTISPEMQQFPYFRQPNDKQSPQMQPPMQPFPPMPPEMPPGMMPALPQGMPGNMPMMPGMPAGMPVPVAMPAGPSHKLPVIVMPFYSPDVQKYSKRHDRHHHRRRPTKKRYRYNSTETDSDEEGSSSSDNTDSSGSSEHGWWRGHKKRKNHKKYGISRRLGKHLNLKKKKSDLLTPILQYVTNDGYVIFEKQISKNEAKTWLGPKDQNQAKEEQIIEKEADFFENNEPKESGEDQERKENREIHNLAEKIKNNRKMKLSKLRTGSLLKPGPQPT